MNYSTATPIETSESTTVVYLPMNESDSRYSSKYKDYNPYTQQWENTPTVSLEAPENEGVEMRSFLNHVNYVEKKVAGNERSYSLASIEYLKEASGQAEDPANILEDKEALDRVKKFQEIMTTATALSSVDRKIWQYHRLEDYSIASIAVFVDMPYDTVRYRINHQIDKQEKKIASKTLDTSKIK